MKHTTLRNTTVKLSIIAALVFGLLGFSATVSIKAGADTGGSWSTNCSATNSSTTNGLCYSCPPGSTTNCIPNPTKQQTYCTSSSCDLVKTYVNPAISVLSALVGVAAVISLIIAGIQYSTSAGDPQKAAAARNRVLRTILALVAYAFFYAFMQWIIPGGILNAGG